MSKVKTENEIQAMREGGAMLAQVLSLMRRKTEPGMTTQQLADTAAEELDKLGGEPAFYQYQGFPAVICISLNEEVVHGIPSGRELQKGDIISFDFGVKYRGLITDSALTTIVGQATNERHQELLKDTQTALKRGIEQVKNKVQTGDIGAAIGGYLQERGYGIVTALVGHGVGHKVHEPPAIPNVGQEGQGPRLTSGMTVAIEPMVTLGGGAVKIGQDGWTVSSRDGSLSAHFEHTVLVTDEGCEILTLRSDKDLEV